MENPKLLYKSPIRFFNIVEFTLFFSFLCFSYIAIIICSDLKFVTLYIVVIIIFYLLFVWTIFASNLSILLIYEDRIEVKHRLYFKKYRCRMFYNKEIIEVRLVSAGGRGAESPGFRIITSKRGLIKTRKIFCYVNKLEDRKKVINHFYNLFIPIKIYSNREEDQHLIER
jgi:hypothetical protein